MHPRARRALSVLLSVAVHALLLLEVYSWSLIRPGFPEQPILPVRIIDAPRPQQAKKAPPKPPPQQVAVAKPPEAAEPAKPAEEPPPEPPQRKLPLPEQQIVSPPDAGKEEAPPDTRLLSDRDNRVEQQTVKKGNPAPGEEAPGPKKQQPAKAPKADKPEQRRGGGRPERPPPPQVAALPSLDRLMPNALRLAEENYAAQPAAQAGDQVAQADQPRRLRQGGSDGLWIPAAGPYGTLDFLPDIKEGDITLLNTKAELFAPFVRRVAIRVFQNFLISLKRDLVAYSALATTETVQAEAVMDMHGEMVEFNVDQRSARISLSSDRRLQQACNDGFFDRNPPPGARSKDGRIHFILRTAVQSAPVPGGRNSYWIQFEAGLL